jgi:sulfide:quinone oxidoreductase
MPETRPTTPENPLRVVIAGGGVAALETLLALHALVGDRVRVELLSPVSEFTSRPLSVGEPFGASPQPGHSLDRIAAEHGARFHAAGLERVDKDMRVAVASDGAELSYHALVIAVGGRPYEAVPHSLTFRDSRDTAAFRALLDELRSAKARSVAFVVPKSVAWPLALYELTLMTGAYVAGHRLDVELSLVTPEDEPLAIFGARASATVRGLLDEARVKVHTSCYAEVKAPGSLQLMPSHESLRVDRIVSVPRLAGPAIPGLPHDRFGFLQTDPHGRVTATDGVYAAGDVTTFPIKQGGLAAQQADAVAESIAASIDPTIKPEPFRPVLRGMLLTGWVPRYLRAEISGGAGDPPDATEHALWWPPGKIAGRYLAPYLVARDDIVAITAPPEGPGVAPVEVAVELVRPGTAGQGRPSPVELHDL